VARGPHAGATLAELIASDRAAVLGDAALSPEGGFPLLVKYLDAAENLSVQVHPSPAYAAAHPGAHLKTESWYVVDADPGGLIYKGVRPGVTPERFRRAIGDGSLVELLHAVPVRAGDTHHLPSGTCHALGAGVLVAEVQTPSDTTFRVFDWGREGRALHVEEAMACIDLAAQPDLEPARAGGEGPTTLVRTGDYTLAERRVRPGRSAPIGRAGAPTVVMVPAGGGSIEGVELERGDTALLPASMAARTFEARAETTLLVIGLPGTPD
jgi:mannose-6-phosphate isomerase